MGCMLMLADYLGYPLIEPEGALLNKRQLRNASDWRRVNWYALTLI